MPDLAPSEERKFAETPPVPAYSAEATPVPTSHGEPEVRHRNFWSWVLYQFFYRIGWQFKMESTLMAGVISYLTPSPAVMGLFTALNALGRNVSPLLAAPLVDRFRHKQRAVLLFWTLTVGAWILLTLLLWSPLARQRPVGVWLFGVSYTTFFFCLGAVGVAQGALLGKIIPAGMRGRAMAVGMIFSGLINVGAILLVSILLQGGRFPEPLNYALSFSITAGLFIVAGAALIPVREAPSESFRRPISLIANLRHFSTLARGNRNLSRLMAANIAVGIGGSMLQFYAAYWRHAGSIQPHQMPLALTYATVAQVFWQCLSSTILGWVADWRGNRVLICWLLWIEAAIPLTAVVLGGWEPFRSNGWWFIGVYSLIGVRFPVFQLLVNYLLEIVPQREHAMAMGAVTAVQLLTTPAPLLLGALARVLGYPVAFLLGSAVIACGAVIALGMKEVRVFANEQ